MAHEITLRVRFSELDPYDHVNHAVLVSYLEAGRIEALREQGIDLSRLRDQGLMLVATQLVARFLGPALAGDRLLVRTTVEQVRRASSIWSQEILRGDRRIVSALLTGAVVDVAGHPRRLPERMRAALEALCDG